MWHWLREKTRGYLTVIVSGATVLMGILDEFQGSGVAGLFGAKAIIVLGIVMFLLRLITKTPIFKHNGGRDAEPV